MALHSRNNKLITSIDTADNGQKGVLVHRPNKSQWLKIIFTRTKRVPVSADQVTAVATDLDDLPIFNAHEYMDLLGPQMYGSRFAVPMNGPYPEGKLVSLAER